MTFKVGENIMNDDVKETKANQDEIENESGYFHDLDSFEEKTDLAPAKRRRVTLLNMTTVLLVLFVCASICVFLFNCVFHSGRSGGFYSKDTGYYSYNGTTYYNQNGRWFEYDELLGWVIADPSEDFLNNYPSYFDGQAYDAQSGVKSFSGSQYYEPDLSFGENNSGNNGADNNRNNDLDDYDRDY